jgi:hypothetical protein
MAAIFNPNSLNGAARTLAAAHPAADASALTALLRALPQWAGASYRSAHNACRAARQSSPVAGKAIPTAAPAKRVPTVEEELQGDRTIRKLQGQVRDLNNKYRHAVTELDRADQRLEVALNIKEGVPEIVIEPRHSEGESEATAIVLYSDWHLEERVDLEMLDGLNEYTPAIAEARAIAIFQNTLKLVQKEREAVRIDELVVWLGGDFITGFIHEELAQTNWLSPIEATRVGKRLLITGLKFLLAHGKFKRIRVICNPGNHGRTTAKMQIANSYKMSYEWMMYHDLKDVFAGDPRMDFHIPTSPFGYLRIYDKTVRTLHGEAIKYGGGIGGVAIPMIKHVQRLNKQRHADMTLVGHFHQSIRPARDIIVNGSLIGFSPYAQKIGCDPEQPQQMFMLCDKKRGFTVTCPIHVT